MRLLERINVERLYVTIPIVLAAVAILSFVPWKPNYFYPSTPEDLHFIRIDASTAFALSYWFEQQVQFGKDIIFAYGPLGFIKYSKYHPATFSWMLIGQVFLYATFVMGAWTLIRNAREKRFVFLMVLFLYGLLFIFNLGALMPKVNITFLTDAFLQSFLILLVANYYFFEQDKYAIISILLAVAAALIALIKVSLLVLALGGVFFITITDIFHKKKLPVIAIAFSGSFLALWYAADQQLANIPHYFLSSLQLTGGYTEAMSYGAPISTNLCEILLYIVSASLFLALLYRKLEPHRLFFNVIPLLLFAGFIFVVFKHSFVRHDGHALEAFYMLCFYLYIILALRRELFDKGAPKILFNAYLGVFVILSLVLIIHWLGPSRHRIPALAQLKQQISLHENAANLLRFVSQGEQPYKESFYAEKEAIRRAANLPPIKVTIDLYPDNIGILTALELKYRPRPVAISHGAYSPFLAIKDAEHLRNSSAPEKILFKVETIDYHYPSMDDGISWPELWTRYADEGRAGEYLILSRLRTPKRYVMSKVLDTDMPFGQWLNLSEPKNALIWAEISIRQTSVGKLLNFVYKLPDVKMVVRLKNNAIKEYRVIPPMLSSGLLLSPLVENTSHFEQILNNASQATPAREVQAVMFYVDNWWSARSSTSALYDSNFTVKIYRLDW